MPARRSLRVLIVILAIAMLGLALRGARAQDEDDGAPTLPETEVFGEQQPGTEPSGDVPPSPFFDEPFNAQGPSSVLEGSMFNSPAVSGYSAGSSTTGTIIDVPDADNPATVNVITSDLMQDQQVLSIQDLARDAGGVSLGAESAFFLDGLLIRGIQLQSRDFRKDGFLDPTFVPRDMQNVERVEILKGPASALYGSGSPAGLLNIITKTPLDATFSDFGFTFGSFGQQRYTLDTNGRVTRSGNLLYRVNIAHEDVDSFRDFGFTSRTLIAPSVTWILDDCTYLTWSAEWHRDHRRGDQGQPALDGDPLALPASRYVGEPANDFIHFEEFRQSLRLTHQINDDWAFNIGGSSLFYEFPFSTTSATGQVPPLPSPTAGPFFFRTRNFLDGQEQSQSAIANLAGDFCTGGFRHQLVVGMEYIYFDSDTTFGQQLLPPIDVTDPTYVNPPPIATTFSTDAPVFRQQRVGAYLQDLLHLNDYWILFGGVRFETVDFTFRRTVGFPVPNPFPPPPSFFVTVPAETEQRFDDVTPRGGIVYQPFGDESLAAYFNYTQAFSPPPSGAYINTDPLLPITGETYEVGVKTLLLDCLTLNVAAFQTTRQNADIQLTSIVITQIGEERSRGAELNLYGQITERWSAVANYAYVDCRLFDETNPAIDGNRQRNVPLNSFNLWTRYNLIMNCERTFGVAIGLVCLDDRPGDLANTFDLPGFGRLDGGLYYRRGRLFADAYFENINGVRYAASSLDQFQVFPGAPFNARCEVGINF